MEKTLIICKPDCVQRRLVGKIIARFESKGLYINALKVVRPTREILEKHYSEHVSKSWFGELIKQMTSGDVVCMILEGKKAVSVCRKIIGATDPISADVGTIRGDLAMSIGSNLTHGSDSIESAEKEIANWFGSFNEIEHFDKDIIYQE